VSSKIKKAFVTGITGQDGAYLTELLLSNGYKVYGGFRRTSSVDFWRLDELNIKDHTMLELIEFDLTDLSSCCSIVNSIKPDEIYNLAAQSFVGTSFKQPTTTSLITGIGALNLLEAIRFSDTNIRYYQASTSEMFGKVQSIPQNEKTSFYPRSPYGVSKLYAHWMTINYRDSYGIFACNGILFNHESPLRGLEFVTRKISYSVARIKLNTLDYIELGNIDAKRDWGYAKDYVYGMWKMMQQDIPDDYVLSTNKTISVRDFLVMAFKAADIEIFFNGDGDEEVAINKANNNVVMKINKDFYRPAEVDLLIGDYTKAKNKLQWEPKTQVEELCKMMVLKDIERVKKEKVF